MYFFCLGFILTSIVSIQIEDGNYPLLHFVTEDSTFSFGSLVDREDLLDLIKGAFPKLNISSFTGSNSRLSGNKEVPETAIPDPLDNEELIQKRAKELILIIQLIKANTCQYFLANNYCPMMIFCGKEHLTKDQLDARIYTQETAGELNLEVITTADFLNTDDAVVRSKQEHTQSSLQRHHRHHSFSESSQNTSLFPNLNLTNLSDLTAIDFGMDRGSTGVLRRSNSMEVMDSNKGNTVKHNLQASGIVLPRDKQTNSTVEIILYDLGAKNSQFSGKIG